MKDFYEFLYRAPGRLPNYLYTACFRTVIVGQQTPHGSIIKNFLLLIITQTFVIKNVYDNV